MKKTRIKALAAAVCLCLSLIPAAGAAEAAGNWQFKEILPCVYDQIRWPDGGVMEVQKDGKWGLLDETGKTVVACQYEDMKIVYLAGDEGQDGLLAVKQNGKWGLIDLTGAAVVPCQYDDMGRGYLIDSAELKLLLRVKKDGKQGFIDQTGTAVIPLAYSDARDFSRNYAAVADAQGKWGFINTDGELEIPCQYSAAGDFNGWPGLAPVEAAGQWQFIDQSGAVQITCQGSYDRVDSFGYGEQFAVATKDQKKGLVDREGKEAMPCQYDAVEVGQAPSEWDDGSWTIYGKQKTYSGGQTAWQYGLLSGDGKVDTGLIYERDWELFANYPSQGLTPVTKLAGQVSAGGSPSYVCGYVDMTGEEVIPCKYDYADDFSYYEALAAVTLNGKAWFIDPMGQTAIPMTYSSVSGFGEDSLAAVATGSYPNYQWGVIDAQGNTVVPCSYTGQWMYLMRDGLAQVQKGNKIGLLALTRPGSEDLKLPAAKVMVKEDGYTQLYCDCSKIGRLTVDGYALSEGEMVLAAMYNEAGKLMKVEILTADKITAWLDTTAATVKLFWLDGEQKPVSPAATLWER